MTFCPIALAVGCQKCPALKICPLKGVIGDMPPSPPPEPEPKANAARKQRAAAATKKSAKR